MASSYPRPCKRCGAKPYEPCVTSLGRRVPAHVARWSCPSCGSARVDLKCWACGWKYAEKKETPVADRPPPPPDAPPRDTLRRAAEDVRVALLDAATRFAYSTALPQIKGTPGGEFMGAVLNAADALRSAVAAHPEAPAATPGATSWRCRCGVWNVSPCRACGAGPDERYASRAELDALAAPPDEARGMTPEEREAYRDLKRRVFASAAPGETPCRHEGADPGYNGSAWVLVCRVCGARYVEGEGWRTPGKEDHHG